MYKRSLMTALENEFEDAGRKFMDYRNEAGGADKAVDKLYIMKLVGKVMCDVQMMINGTLGTPALKKTE